MAESFAKGRKLLLCSHSYAINDSIAGGDRLAVEVLWSGRLAVSLGTLSAARRCERTSPFFDG
jgi:hypothetical protein